MKHLSKVIVMRNRNFVLDSTLLKHRVFVYNGKTDVYVPINNAIIGNKLGSLALTKKLGKSIHNTKRNEKNRKKKHKK